MYTLEVSGDKKSVISCPVSEPQPEWTDEIEDPRKWVTLHIHFILKMNRCELAYLTLPSLQGYRDPQPPASQVPPTDSDLLYPQLVPEQPTPLPSEEPWENYFFPQKKPIIEKPEGPGELPFNPPEPVEHPDKPAVGKPGAHQGKEEYTPVIPPEPQKPQPDLSQSVYWPFYPYPSKPEQVPEKQPEQPEKKPVHPQLPGYPPVYPTYPPHPEQKPVHPQLPGYPPVYPTYPPQPGKPAEKPETSPGKEYTPFYPSYPRPQPEKQPEEKPVQKPHLPLAPPDKPVQSHQPNPIYSFNYPKYIPYVPPAGQNPEEPIVPQPNAGGVVPPFYCICPSGFGNCCPQFAFHQHHHHILPVAPGSRDVPPIYTGLPMLPLAAYPGLDGGSGSPAAQPPNKPVSTLAPSAPPDKRLYLQPHDGGLAKPEGLPEQANVHVDPQGVGQFWSYSPAGQASEEAVNPAAQHHLFMMHPPKGQYQSSPGNMNYAPVPHFFSPRPQQHAAKQQPVSEVQSWSPYIMLQDAQERTQNISAPSRSPPATRPANEHDQIENASSDSNSYLLLQRGPPGKVPHLFSEPRFALRRPVPHGLDQSPSDTSPEKLRASREKTAHPRWLMGMPTSFPSRCTLYRP